MSATATAVLEPEVEVVAKPQRRPSLRCFGPPTLSSR